MNRPRDIRAVAGTVENRAPPRCGVRDQIRKSTRPLTRRDYHRHLLRISQFVAPANRSGLIGAQPENLVSTAGIFISRRCHHSRKKNSTETNHPGSDHGGRSPQRPTGSRAGRGRRERCNENLQEEIIRQNRRYLASTADAGKLIM